MIPIKIVEKFANTDCKVRIEQSRCLQMRFNQNSCNTCRDYCISGAITIGEELHIDQESCSECMLCTSVCPSEAFAIDPADFYAVITRLRKITSPVLSCRVKPDLYAHEKTFCLGFLSEEHIIALSVFIKAPLQLNLSSCKECQNRSIVDILKERLRNVNTKTSINIFEKIKLVESMVDLDFQETALDRRKFFQALKDFSTQSVKKVFRQINPREVDRAYSEKVLPSKRELLNKTLLALPPEIKKRL